MNCPTCGSVHVQSRGTRNGKNRFQCQNDACPQQWFSTEMNTSDVVDVSAPNILVFDIETSTILAELYDLGKQYVGRKSLKESWYILSWSAQWLKDDEVFGDVVTSKEAKLRDDKRVVKSLWDTIDEADILISYNGDGFDIPRFNRRSLECGLMRPSHYQSIDLYKTIRNTFEFESNALDFVCERLQLERKRNNGGWELWQDATAGVQKALDEMIYYGLGDIPPTQELYFEIRTWIKNHPKMSLYNVDETEPMCNFCGSTDIAPKDKLVSVGLNLYRSFRCKSCGGIGRYKEGQLSKEKRKNMSMGLRY